MDGDIGRVAGQDSPDDLVGGCIALLYYPSDWDTGDKERNVELADELNENLGVTPAQRQAMEIGSMVGWDVPGADPGNYEIQREGPEEGGMTLG